MLWKDRILSALLAAAIAVAAGAAVRRFAPESPLYAPNRLAEGITLEATGIPSRETIVSVDGNGAEADMLTYWVGYYGDYIESAFGMDLAQNWDMPLDGTSTLKDLVREEALSTVKQELVLENLAARSGAALTAEDESEIAALRAANAESRGGEEAYLAALYEMGVSDETLARIMRTNYYYTRLYESYCTPGSPLYADDDVLHAYAAGSGWITADHILLMTIDQQTREPLPAEEIARKHELAEDLLRRLSESDDPLALFPQLAAEYSEDGGRAMYPDGYTFTRGTMVEEFDSAARALGENEYSAIVESPYGYHVILRKPLNVGEAVEGVRQEYFEILLRGEFDRSELVEAPAAARYDVAAVWGKLSDVRSAAAEREAQASQESDPFAKWFAARSNPAE